jgi:uncharacterized LabA/DUF88 family protein
MAMRVEPVKKRVCSFFDGQNLYHAAKEAFGYTYPNYDPLVLSDNICRLKGWELVKANFYTGLPDPLIDPRWHQFWELKLAVMSTRGVHTYSRALKYSNQPLILPDRRETTVLVGREKGVDIRIALDVVRMARHGDFDVAMIFSQDQDLSEVAAEVREISKEHDRWMKVVCAFPISPTLVNQRGINGTDWIRIDRKMYDACLDQMDYRLNR